VVGDACAVAETLGKSAIRRARRPSLREPAFLTKALELFCASGFDGTSIDAITAAAGIAKRTVYARYGDKENLFKLAIERAIDEWNVPVETLRAAELDDLENSLLAIGHILVDNILTPAGLQLLRLTNAESGRMPWIGEHNVRYGEGPVIAYLADLLSRKLPESAKTQIDSMDAAEIFLHLVVGGPANAAAWGVMKDKAAIDRRTRLSIKIYMQGLLSITGSEAATTEFAATRDYLNDLSHVLLAASQQLTKVRAGLRQK
jgi:TetR/AcrR family transcriptional repressor of mexJK operon